MVDKWVTAAYAFPMRKRVALLQDDMAATAALGRRIRAARLRRNWSQAEMAQRAGVTRKTYAALEGGDSGVSLGCLVKTLSILGYPERLATVMDADPIGAGLELGTGRRRAGRIENVADI
jgi:DNA-binding XRE family transcriptional regulator